MGTAFITGGAVRVGREIALHLAENGYNIILHFNKSEKSAQSTKGEVENLGVSCELLQADFCRPESLRGIFDDREVNLLVNNASTFPKGNFTSIALDSWQNTLSVNLTSPLVLIQEMTKTQPNGVIVNIGDTLAERPSQNFAEHSVSKAALKHLTLVTAKELAPHFRVNMIIPGPILIPDTMAEERWVEITSKPPLGGGSPRNIARMVLHIAQNDYITGSVIHVDGGDHLL